MDDPIAFAFGVISKAQPHILQKYQCHADYKSALAALGVIEKPKTGPVRLLDGALKKLPQIEEYLAKGPQCATGHPEDQTQDIRFADINLAKQIRSDESQFRAYLALRSFAQSFDLWERRVYKVSRVNNLVQDPKKSQNKQGRVSKFVRLIGALDIKDGSDTLAKGIKILVLERLYGCVGISVMVFFQLSLFNRLKYPEVQDFLDLVQGKSNNEWGDEDGGGDESRESHPTNKIMEVALSAADFVNHCQQIYESEFP